MMMRWSALLMCAALMHAPAMAVGLPPPVPHVILHEDVPLVTVYAWERWGNFINALAGSKTEIPYDAARLQVKVYTYPTGEIRAIRFANGVRTHRHINQTDTILYSWQAHRVQFVDDKAMVTEPGDFALHQKGVYHSGEEIRRGGGIDLEFAITIPGVHNDPTAYWSLAKDQPIEPAASWMIGSNVVEVVGAASAAAPATAVRYRVREAKLAQYAARELYLPKGTILPSQDMGADRLFFVLSGRIRVSIAGRDYTLASEDTAQATKGERFTVEALDDALVVQASVPAGK